MKLETEVEFFFGYCKPYSLWFRDLFHSTAVQAKELPQKISRGSARKLELATVPLTDSLYIFP
jgi:hypothetical protein